MKEKLLKLKDDLQKSMNDINKIKKSTEEEGYRILLENFLIHLEKITSDLDVILDSIDYFNEKNKK